MEPEAAQDQPDSQQRLVGHVLEAFGGAIEVLLAIVNPTFGIGLAIITFLAVIFGFRPKWRRFIYRHMDKS